ncbi:polysaccharide biosynthesis tyrosine autokinase [Zhongshania sp.]|uniref:polysaccharide biosynthesis tyrosine autokinase n=1 Tax=Zhongshania sp. TaxID=1971902 RepID=UPI003562CB6E
MNSSNTSKNLPYDVEESEVDLSALLEKLVQYRFWLLLSVLIFLGVGFFYLWVTPPVYQANVVIQVESNKSIIPGMDEVTSALVASSGTSTEIELMRSRTVISEAIDRLSLDLLVMPRYFPVVGEAIARQGGSASELREAPLESLRKYGWGGEFLDFYRFVVPPSMTGREHVVRYLGSDEYVLLSPEGRILLQGAVGEVHQGSGYQIGIQSITALPGTEFIVRRQDRLDTILSYQALLNASEVGADTGIIEVTTESRDADLALRFLDIVTKSFIRRNVERHSEEASKSLDFLKGQLPEITEELERYEAEFNQYKVEVGSVDISLETGALLDQIVGIESSLAQLKMEKIELESKFNPGHPSFDTLQNKINELQSRKAKLNGQVANLPETQQELFGLRRNLDVSTAVYTQMLNNIQELDIVKAGTVGNVRIVDEAIVNRKAPVKPKKILVLMVSLCCGVVLGLVLVIVRESLRRGIMTVADLEKLGLVVYSSIPLSNHQEKLDGQKQKLGWRKLGGVSEVEPKLLAALNPADISIEALRSLRTSLHFAMLEAENNLIMISGPSPGVGKSFISANLAAVVAQTGRRVLVVDADMRRGYMHKIAGVGVEPGLSDVLAGQIGLDEAIRPTDVDGLFVLARGSVPPNPSELLMSKGVQSVFDSVGSTFDLVIVDTPPVMAVTDATIVGQYCGVTMLVTRFGVSLQKEIEVTSKRLLQNGITVKGAVLNAVERPATSYAYGYGYSHYSYDYYGKNN